MIMNRTIAILLAAMLLAPATALCSATPDFQSKYLAVGLSRSAPAFSVFAVDSLGRGKLDQNPVLAEPNAVPGLELVDGSPYKLSGQPVWRITCGQRTLTLHSNYTAGIAAPPFVLMFSQKLNHATLLGLMKPGERQMALPCVLHLPDMGSLRDHRRGETRVYRNLLLWIRGGWPGSWVVCREELSLGPARQGGPRSVWWGYLGRSRSGRRSSGIPRWDNFRGHPAGRHRQGSLRSNRCSYRNGSGICTIRWVRSTARPLDRVRSGAGWSFGISSKSRNSRRIP